MTLVGLDGQAISLDQSWNPMHGGEGTVYRSADGHMIKIYHPNVLSSRGQMLEAKVRYMKDHPPMGGALKYLAWPVDVVYENGAFKGFMMNALSGYEEVSLFYSYLPNQSRPQNLLL